MNKAAGANGRHKTVGATATRRRGYRRRKPDNETATGLEILEPAVELRVRCRSTKWLARAFSSDADQHRSRRANPSMRKGKDAGDPRLLKNSFLASYPKPWQWFWRGHWVRSIGGQGDHAVGLNCGQIVLSCVQEWNWDYPRKNSHGSGHNQHIKCVFDLQFRHYLSPRRKQGR